MRFKKDLIKLNNIKGDICPLIRRVNERMEKLGLEPYSPEYLCQRDSCNGCYLQEIATNIILDYDLR
ncbi:MAG: hypothetical protein KAT28_02895 [Candidatus Aenigmarchaeota archaeon]|nr:hypothetical protein [Candidatus Aenigmarchaeota archaeon]